ncbi:hypothetical protein [Anaerospora hongkongensis]|uniref:hypothetical protein n=1 Tax=Anaerospora hongkongensis TaxID=244830 RepID=UPI0010499C7A|nr:hypothetical protein [Anaerospora hongkongensis]
MLFVSTGRDGRGHGRARTACLPPGQASGTRWPGVAVGCFVFRSRRSAGRPAGSVDGVPAGPAGVACRGPAQCAGPADVTRSPGASDKECPGLHPMPSPNCLPAGYDSKRQRWPVGSG